MIDYLTIGIAALAILISLFTIVFNIGAVRGWICFHGIEGKPTGWRYWPWAYRFYREHGSWPI